MCSVHAWNSPVSVYIASFSPLVLVRSFPSLVLLLYKRQEAGWEPGKKASLYVCSPQLHSACVHITQHHWLWLHGWVTCWEERQCLYLDRVLKRLIKSLVCLGIEMSLASTLVRCSRCVSPRPLVSLGGWGFSSLCGQMVHPLTDIREKVYSTQVNIM